MYKILDEKIFDNSAVSEPFVSFNSSKPLDEFDCVQKLVEIKKGIVMPRLNESYVNIVEVEPHDFYGEKPLVEAQNWAENNLVGKYTSHEWTLNRFKYKITKKSIKKYLNSTSINKSENLPVHLSVLKVLPKIIDNSVEAEIHADYTKVNGIRSVENPVNKNVLIHRFYGSIFFIDKMYRVKTTIYEFRDTTPNKPYTFEVIKIELLDESNSSILAANDPNSLGGLTINTANLLQNVEKSYDKGKFLLEESKKDEEFYNSVIFWH